MYCGNAALTLAICSNALELLLFYSRFHNGGGPQGVGPSTEIWDIIGRISVWSCIASIVLSAFGKGIWRLFIPAWAVAYAFVLYAMFILIDSASKVVLSQRM